nr:AlpA family phage regulatory protein [Sphingopyxis sp.]
MERVGLRRTAIYQRMREGRFPQSRSLGSRCTVWVESKSTTGSLVSKGLESVWTGLAPLSS